MSWISGGGTHRNSFPDCFTIQLLLVIQGLSLLFLVGISLISVNALLFDVAWIGHLLIHLCLVLGSIGALFVSLSALSRLSAVVIVTAILLLLTGPVLEALTPVLSRDALLYHLAVPKWWLECGAQCEIEWHEWSYFPLQTSLAYLGFLKLGLLEVVPFYHLSYLLVLVCLIVSLFENQNPVAGALAGLTLLATPLLQRLAPAPLADIPSALYLLSGGIALAKYLYRESLPTAPPTLYLALGALSLGFGMATKYTSFLSAFLMWQIFALVCLRHTRSLPVLLMVITTGLLALLAPLPWLIRNFIWTGNPAYPFLQSFFGSGSTIAFSGELPPLVYRQLQFGESWLEIVLIPLRFFLQGKDGDPQYFAGVLSPYLLLGAIPAILYWKESRASRFAAIFSVLYTAVTVSVFYAYVRYQLIVVALLSLGVGFLWHRTSLKLGKQAIVAGLLLHLTSGLLYQEERLQSLGVTEYVSGALSKEHYLTKNVADYEAIAAYNKHSTPDSKAYLLLTGNKFFYFEAGVEGSYFSQQPVLEALTSPSPFLTLEGFFTSRRVTHLIFHEARVARTLVGLTTDISRPHEAWLTFLRTRCRPLYRSRGRALCELTPGPEINHE